MRQAICFAPAVFYLIVWIAAIMSDPKAFVGFIFFAILVGGAFDDLRRSWET